jgi:capsular polysaccharide biosynthesis protein
VELKHVLRIVLRRWPVILILPVMVAALALVQERSHEPTYSSTLRASVIRHPDPSLSSEDAYYNYVASEFAIDDLVEAVRGNVFASAVAERAREASGGSMPPASIGAERRHRILEVRIESRDAAVAEAVAQAAAAELEERAFEYLGMSAAESSAIVQVIQRPSAAQPDTGRHQLLLLLQLLAAFGAGVLLAFLVDYLDDAIYDADTASLATRLPLLTKIPRDGGT